MKRRSPGLHIYMYVNMVAITWLVMNWVVYVIAPGWKTLATGRFIFMC
jgi:hypothetical protein